MSNRRRSRAVKRAPECGMINRLQPWLAALANVPPTRVADGIKEVRMAFLSGKKTTAFMLPHLALALGIFALFAVASGEAQAEDAISAKGHNKKINLPGAPTIAANPASTLSAAAHESTARAAPEANLAGSAIVRTGHAGSMAARPERSISSSRAALASRSGLNSRAVLPGLAAVGSGQRSAATARPRLAQTAAMPDAGATVAKRPGALLERSALGAESGQNRPAPAASETQGK